MEGWHRCHERTARCSLNELAQLWPKCYPGLWIPLSLLCQTFSLRINLPFWPFSTLPIIPSATPVPKEQNHLGWIGFYEYNTKVFSFIFSIHCAFFERNFLSREFRNLVWEHVDAIIGFSVRSTFVHETWNKIEYGVKNEWRMVSTMSRQHADWKHGFKKGVCKLRDRLKGNFMVDTLEISIGFERLWDCPAWTCILGLATAACINPEVLIL